MSQNLGKIFLSFVGIINKCYFLNEPTPQFSEVPSFKTKSLWRRSNGHLAIKIFLGKVENGLFDICKK